MSPILESIGSVKGFGWGKILSSTAFESIATATVGAGGAANVEFTSIPATFKHLQIRAMAKSSRTDSPIATYNVSFNGDTSSIYSYHRLTGGGTAAGASGGGGNSEGYLYSMAASQTVSSSTFGVAIFDILDYATSNKNRVLRFLGGSDGNGSSTGFISLGGVGYFSTNAISSIRFRIDGGSNFIQYTQFALYGIKAA